MIYGSWTSVRTSHLRPHPPSPKGSLGKSKGGAAAAKGGLGKSQGGAAAAKGGPGISQGGAFLSQMEVKTHFWPKNLHFSFVFLCFLSDDFALWQK